MTTCYHPDLKLAYIHIPKCAGTSIGGNYDPRSDSWWGCWLNDVLPGWTRQGLPNGHQPVASLERWTGIPVEDFKRIIVTIRNPFAQQVSQYAFWRARSERQAAAGMGYHPDDVFASSVTFSRFVECPQSNGPNAMCGENWREYGGVYRWWAQYQGEIPPNVRIVPVENLEEGLSDAIEGLGGTFKPVPRDNTVKHPDWTKWYDERSAAAVRDKFTWSLATYYPELLSLDWLTDEPIGAEPFYAAID